MFGHQVNTPAKALIRAAGCTVDIHELDQKRKAESLIESFSVFRQNPALLRFDRALFEFRQFLRDAADKGYNVYSISQSEEWKTLREYMDELNVVHSFGDIDDQTFEMCTEEFLILLQGLQTSQPGSTVSLETLGL